MKKEIIIYGTGGHALVVVDVIRQLGDYTIAGFLVDPEYPSGSDFCGIPLLGDKTILPRVFERGVRHAFVAFGDNRRRYELGKQLQESGFNIPVLIHPSAIVSGTAQIGPGSIVMAGAVIQPDCRIGEGVIINTGAGVDHECVLGEGVHISPGAHLSGKVQVGQFTHIGIGASVVDKVKIGQECIIGAGGAVIGDLPDKVTAVGVPVKIIKHNS